MPDQSIRVSGVIQNLTTLRTELQRELKVVNAALTAALKAAESGAPAQPKLAPKAAAKRNNTNVMQALVSGPLTAMELSRKTGISSAAIYKVLARMANQNMIERREINGVNHFQRIPQEVRIIAGDGVIE